MVIAPRHGRLLGDFAVGATYRHPWEVTVDEGMVALYAASFQDATPLYASSEVARALNLRARPLHPLLCMNLGLSFSVHDVSEQAIAHLAYLDIRFPDAGFCGDTVTARSTVIDVKPSSSGDKGVVHVRTLLETSDGRTLCAFERKALIRAGKLADRAAGRGPSTPSLAELRALPLEIASCAHLPGPGGRFDRFCEDLVPGQIYAHGLGHTVGESEHMQLTTLLRNSHPLHFDALYAQGSSFTTERVVYGGLVFAWVCALASRDVAGNSLWDLRYTGGAHPASVAAGDTIYAASKVLAVASDEQDAVGQVTFALVGVKNVTALAAVERHGDALFDAELGKKQNRLPEKVFEIQRTLLIRRRPRAAEGSG
ncbi:MAG: MaoC family dehydratase [Myxococcales bacterium]|nr:MaoC family dehydratase [Myxococcales bacterium]